MHDCCTHKVGAVEQLRKRQATTLRWVLYANAAMFIVELVYGVLAGSMALLADSLEMLGDALV
ncbi:MAG: cation transporter [Gammaproteobacteria bacterium]|nr:cation transporter [Gammaproteobacteria bacterium]